MRSRYLLATCAECRTVTAVTETYWPATRYDPLDGALSPEECSECGTPFDDATEYGQDEPPERDHRERRVDDDE